MLTVIVLNLELVLTGEAKLLSEFSSEAIYIQIRNLRLKTVVLAAGH